jgi:DNA-binding response OmpR family regulator
MSAPLGSGPAVKPRVLVVEDDSASHDVLRRILDRKGYDVLSAMTVSGALALLERRPDAIVLDLMLPDGDGETVLRKVRSDGLPVRVLVASAVCDQDRLEQVRRLGPDAILTKPINLGELLRTLEAPAA